MSDGSTRQCQHCSDVEVGGRVSRVYISALLRLIFHVYEQT